MAYGRAKLVGFPSPLAGNQMPRLGMSLDCAKFIWTSPLAARSSPLSTLGASLPVEADGPTLFVWSFFRYAMVAPARRSRAWP